MSRNLKQDWMDALGIIMNWNNKIDTDKKVVDNCCENEEELREWSLKINSITCFLTIVRKDNDIMLQLYAPLMKTSSAENQNFLYEQLLRLNATTLTLCSFGIEEDDTVVLMSDCSMKGINHEKIDSIVHHFSNAIERLNNRNLLPS